MGSGYKARRKLRKLVCGTGHKGGTLSLTSPCRGTKRKTSLTFVFRKYPRAQITPFSDLYRIQAGTIPAPLVTFQKICFAKLALIDFPE